MSMRRIFEFAQQALAGADAAASDKALQRLRALLDAHLTADGVFSASGVDHHGSSGKRIDTSVRALPEKDRGSGGSRRPN
jgi:hypothetical protein